MSVVCFCTNTTVKTKQYISPAVATKQAERLQLITYTNKLAEQTTVHQKLLPETANKQL